MQIRVIVAAFTAIFLATLARGQSLSSTGRVEGVVVDSGGAVVPGSEVRLRNRGTSALRVLQSDGAGRFQFTTVPIGRYSLTVSATGFASFQIEMFFVSVGQAVVQRVELAPAGVVEKVEVKAETEALQAASTTSSIALGYDRIEETPSQNRNYLSFVFSAPGMSPSSGADSRSHHLRRVIPP